MQQIINLNQIIKGLKDKHLKIDDPNLLKETLFNYNYNTVIQGYSDIFFVDKNKKEYDSLASSNQIIEFYHFDINFANHLLRYILQIEKKLNTNIAYALINAYSITDRCLFKLTNDFIQRFIFPNYKIANPMLTYDNFIKQLTKYLDTNEYTKKYQVKNVNKLNLRWENVPLDLMCLTWSFSTTLNVFLSLNEEIIRYIADDFGVLNGNISGFIDFIKNILHLRNLISHNYVIYQAKMKFQSNSLNKMYFDLFGIEIKQVTLRHIIQMIEKFVNKPDLISKTITEFNKLKIDQKFKNKVQLFGQKKRK